MTRSAGTERAWRNWLLGHVRQRYPAIWRQILREEWYPKTKVLEHEFPAFAATRIGFFAGAGHGLALAAQHIAEGREPDDYDCTARR